jgi:hypothetical protein
MGKNIDADVRNADWIDRSKDVKTTPPVKVVRDENGDLVEVDKGAEARAFAKLPRMRLPKGKP